MRETKFCATTELQLFGLALKTIVTVQHDSWRLVSSPPGLELK